MACNSPDADFELVSAVHIGGMGKKKQICLLREAWRKWLRVKQFGRFLALIASNLCTRL
jgi:hypothetical protein